MLSSVGFGILHLSVLSLSTHVPLGLSFGRLRQRSGSLYPPMFAHFVHDGLVMADAYLGAASPAAGRRAAGRKCRFFGRAMGESMMGRSGRI